MSTETLPCLLRQGDDNVKKKLKLFKLDRNKVTIGRSEDVTYKITSIMISRCHAILERCTDQTWTIEDNKSLNGVTVNGHRLKPLEPHPLQDNDVVQFGVPTSPDVPPEFVYKFHSALKIRVERKNKRVNHSSGQTDDCSNCQRELTEENSTISKKRKTDQESHVEERTTNKLEDEHSVKIQAAKQEEFKVKLAELEQRLKEKEEKQTKVEKQLELERQQKEMQAKEVKELKMKEQAILMEMKLKQDELEKEKDELKKNMEKELEENLKAKETVLVKQLLSQKVTLLEEKSKVEESLKAEMTKALEEKDKDLEHKLVKMKQDLEKATSLDCAHAFCKLCISQWMKVKKECPICRKPITSHMQAIALDNYIDTMVEKFSDELKERRQTLLDQRKVQQAEFDAGPSKTAAKATTARTMPRGRARTRGGASTRGQRTAATTVRSIITTRAGLAAAVVTSNAINPPRTQTATTSGLSRTSTATTAMTATATTSTTTVIDLDGASTSAANTTVISVNDSASASASNSDSESDLEDCDGLYADRWHRDTSDDSDSVDGEPDAVYGGYGRCYNCGSRGHWAPGCPN